MSKILVVLLAIIAGGVTYLQYRKKPDDIVLSPWMWIVLYWAVLTVKNIIDIW